MAIKLAVPLNSVNNKNLDKAAALVTLKGGLVNISLTTGLLEVAGVATGPNQVVWIANENIAAADARTSVLGTEARKGDQFLADTVANSSAVHNGQRMLLNATGFLLNNSGTDAPAGVFEQISVVGAPADRKIIVSKV